MGSGIVLRGLTEESLQWCRGTVLREFPYNHAAMRSLTSWTIIEAAAGGDAEAREVLARRYEPVVRAYLEARWQTSRHSRDVDDGVQDVFLDLLRPSGPLLRAEPGRPGGFRAFLYGITRLVALRVESGGDRRRPDPDGDLDRFEGDEATLSKVFDAAWARMVLSETLEELIRRAEEKGERALRRVDLLRQHIMEERTLKGIADASGRDAAAVRREYAAARQEFRSVLLQVLARHAAGPEPVTEKDALELLQLLGSARS